MKTSIKFFAVVGLAFMLSGCGVLLPKRVEFFQDKVQTFPEARESEKETQRQAARLAEVKATETLTAALTTAADPTVIAPATDTALLTGAVSDSLGPPATPATKPAKQVALDLNKATAKQNSRVEDFKKDNNENAGKKIEGTGLFSIGYFTMWGGILAAGAIIWFGLKIYGTVNPIVGIGTNVVGRVSSAMLKKGLTEITEGGEWFKEAISEAKQETFSKDEVKALFQRWHAEAQSRDTQKLIEQLTQK